MRSARKNGLSIDSDDRQGADSILDLSPISARCSKGRKPKLTVLSFWAMEEAAFKRLSSLF